MKAVLVIDNDPSVRSSVVDSLRNAGFAALSTAMETELLEVVSRAPDLLGLILVDAAAASPLRSDFLAIVRKAFPRLPIIGMSEDARRGRGVTDGCIAKPLRLEVVLSVAREFCSERSSSDVLAS